MKIRIEIDCDNDAFRGSPAGDPADEVSRILTEYGKAIRTVGLHTIRRLHDRNGNTCGQVEVE